MYNIGYVFRMGNLSWDQNFQPANGDAEKVLSISRKLGHAVFGVQGNNNSNFVLRFEYKGPVRSLVLLQEVSTKVGARVRGTKPCTRLRWSQSPAGRCLNHPI